MPIRAALILSILAAVSSAQSLYEEINYAIDRGIQRILTYQQPDGSFALSEPSQLVYNEKYPPGVTALATYTLLKSGYPVDSSEIQKALTFLDYEGFKKVYSVSVRILALDATRNPKYSETIRAAAQWLEENLDTKANVWGYPEPEPDMSNTQFAALALWIASKHGYEAHPEMWERVIQGSIEHQNKDGGFGYHVKNRPQSSGSMTTAGITSLAIARDRLRARRAEARAQAMADAALERGWAYLDRTFTPTGNPVGITAFIEDRFRHGSRFYFGHHYFLWGIERVAALCERKEIAGKDWYEEGAVELLVREKDGGGWDTLENTCFALLFLKRAMFTDVTGEDSGSVFGLWRWTTEAPAGDWMSLDFDDRRWSYAAQPFGSGLPDRAIRTDWQASDVWVRRRFRWPGGDPKRFRVFGRFDDKLELYVNGVLAATRPTYSSAWSEVEIAEEALATLKQGDENLLAARCTDTGGAQFLELRLAHEGYKLDKLQASTTGVEGQERWWKNRPTADVPFLRRWLVLGPVKNPKDLLLLESALPDAEVRPEIGDRDLGQRWQVLSSTSQLVDLRADLGDAEKSIAYAWTMLEATESTEVVLWVGSDDGCQVLVDGEVRLTHHDDQGVVADTFPILLRLNPGLHPLLIKVENNAGGWGFCARLCNKDGSRTTAVTSTLFAPGAPGRGDDQLRAAPRGVELADLFEGLAVSDLRKGLDFEDREHVEQLLITAPSWSAPFWREGRAHDGDPLPVEKRKRKGYLALAPGGDDPSTRAIAKVKVKPGKTELRLRVSTEQAAAAGAHLRVGAFAGELSWIAEHRLTSAGAEDWRELAMDFGAYADREILLVVEVLKPAEGQGTGWLFVDEIEWK